MLGLLNPSYLLAGSMELDSDLAWRTCERIGREVGLSAVDAASGIRTIVNSAMVGAIRTITVGVGRDPRDFALVAYGGAGPLHAVELAESLGIQWVIVPPHPGCQSAFGLLVTDLVHDYGQSFLQPCSTVVCPDVEREFRALARRAYADTEAAGLTAERTLLHRSLGMRYVGQNASLVVGVTAARFTGRVLREAVDEFHRLHERTFGFSAAEEMVELVELRVQGVGRITRPEQRPLGVAELVSRSAPAGRRDIAVDRGALTKVPVYLRAELARGSVIAGPSVIEQFDSTIFVPRGWKATVEALGALVIGQSIWPGTRRASRRRRMEAMTR